MQKSFAVAPRADAGNIVPAVAILPGMKARERVTVRFVGDEYPRDRAFRARWMLRPVKTRGLLAIQRWPCADIADVRLVLGRTGPEPRCFTYPLAGDAIEAVKKMLRRCVGDEVVYVG